MTENDRHRPDLFPARGRRIDRDTNDNTQDFDQNDADPFNEVTDLPLPQSGNGGNHVGEPEAAAGDPRLLLEDAAEQLPDPPIHVLDAQVVLDWIEHASARLAFREDRRRLAREAMQLLDRDFRTALNVGRLQQQFDRQAADQCARQACTYWAQREKRRRAQQPTHVEVDLDAWRTMRAVSAKFGRSVGDEVGRLVVAEVVHPADPAFVRARSGRSVDTGHGRRANIFARLAVTKTTWSDFRSLAVVRDTSVARYVGLLVEHAMRDRPEGFPVQRLSTSTIDDNSLARVRNGRDCRRGCLWLSSGPSNICVVEGGSVDGDTSAEVRETGSAAGIVREATSASSPGQMVIARRRGWRFVDDSER